MSNGEIEKPTGAATLDKGLGVLLAVARSNEGMTLTEVARALELNKATALRMLRSLENTSFVWRRANGTYTVGPAGIQLSFLAEQELYLRDIVLPAMQEITRKTGEATSYFVIVRNERMCVAVLPGRYPVSANTRKGDLYPVGRGSAGRALVAYRGGWDGEAPLQAFVALGERDPELAGVSTAIFDPAGDLMGAITIAGTVQRFSTPNYVEHLKAVLLQRCEILNRELRQASPLDGAVRRVRNGRTLPA
jgi:DNA-binding IclR family transcriptional regulator